MDPVAKRFMWEVIGDIVTKREKCSLILTTHSMEECEALCTRIGIMVGGVLRCLGSNQRLRSRYGLGFQMELSFSIPSPDEVYEKLKLISGIANFAVTEHSDPLFYKDVTIKVLNGISRPQWISRLKPDDTGAELLQGFESSGYVLGRHLASWIILEDRYDELLKFFDSHFSGYILRERQSAKVRVEIPSQIPGGGTRRLAGMFGAMESRKEMLSVSEYSVSQTSLEQIFNQFASQQEEEKGIAAGLR